MRVHWMDPDVVLITYHVQIGGTDHGQRFSGDAYASSLWVRNGKEWLNTFCLDFARLPQDLLRAFGTVWHFGSGEPQMVVQGRSRVRGETIPRA